MGVPTSASTVRLREAPGRKGAACPPPSPPSAHPLTHAAQLLALPRQSEPSAVVSLTRGAGEQEAAPLLLCPSPLHCCLLHPLECAPRSGSTQPVSTSLYSAGPRGPGACAHVLKHTRTRAHRGTHTLMRAHTHPQTHQTHTKTCTHLHTQIQPGSTCTHLHTLHIYLHRYMQIHAHKYACIHTNIRVHTNTCTINAHNTWSTMHTDLYSHAHTYNTIHTSVHKCTRARTPRHTYVYVHAARRDASAQIFTHVATYRNRNTCTLTHVRTHAH